VLYVIYSSDSIRSTSSRLVYSSNIYWVLVVGTSIHTGYSEYITVFIVYSTYRLQVQVSSTGYKYLLQVLPGISTGYKYLLQVQGISTWYMYQVQVPRTCTGYMVHLFFHRTHVIKSSIHSFLHQSFVHTSPFITERQQHCKCHYFIVMFVFD
jgi:hypothetical protein